MQIAFVVDARTLAAQTSPAQSTGDVAIVAGIVLFFLVFAVLGAIFLKKKRVERIDALARELDKPLLSTDTDTAAARVPKAEDLAAAQREALVAKTAQDAARRALERANAAADADLIAAAASVSAAASAAAVDSAMRAKALRMALSQTRDGLVGKLKRSFGGKTLDAGALDDLETILFGSDIGAHTAQRLLTSVKAKLSANELDTVDKLENALRAQAKAILATVDNRPLALAGDTPRVLLVLGVNGAGKTTTIGKLAAQLKGQGKRVLLGAGDTFRAAASDQLEVWAKRADVPVVVGADGADPSSVLFEAAKRGKDEGFDVVLCDTAGRLHTKVNLMEELKKVVRTLAKAVPGAPHEVLLVLDATVGQNAIAQARQFGEAASLSGIVLTKLDGTAKGGVVLGIVDELKVPVRYVGIGESIDDLRPFDADAFVDALFAA